MRAPLSRKSSPIAVIPAERAGTRNVRSRETIFFSLTQMNYARELCDSERDRDPRAVERDRRSINHPSAPGNGVQCARERITASLARHRRAVARRLCAGDATSRQGVVERCPRDGRVAPGCN